MVQFLSIFVGFLQFLLGFSKVPVFCVTLYYVYKHIVMFPLKNIKITSIKTCARTKKYTPRKVKHKER